jgi:hypothetical protein
LAEEQSVELTEPEDRVAHWVQVIDTWVRQVDQAMGTAAEGVDPPSEPDPAPEVD